MERLHCRYKDQPLVPPSGTATRYAVLTCRPPPAQNNQ